MKKIYSLALTALLGVAFTVTSCEKEEDKDMNTDTPTEDNSLYGRLGGTTMVSDPTNSGVMIEQGRLGLRSVVDSSILVIAANPDLQPYFEPLLQELGNGNTSNLAVLSKNLTDFFCVATGSQNFSYDGLDMKAAHDPAQNPRMALKADDKAMDDFIAAVGTGATQVGVPSDLIGEVAALIETLRDDVVQSDGNQQSLYDKLGGTTMVNDPANSGQMIEQGRLGLRSVVDSSILVIAGNPDLQPYFEVLLQELGNGNTTNLAILSKNLTDFFCVATGAQNFTYAGVDMKAAHDPAQNSRMALKADNKAMDDFIAAVGTGAQQNNVPNELIGEVAALIETLRGDVVQR